MKYVICTILALVFVSAGSIAQVTQEWEKRYNGPVDSADLGNSLLTDAAGNVYVTGTSRGALSGNDFVTIKYNSAGVQQWLTRYNSPANTYDYAVAIALDVSGNVYVTGYSGATGLSTDYVTVKYNASGVQQWTQTYNGTGNGEDKTTAIAVDASGNVYITGYSSAGTGNTDYVTIKYNTAGVQQWLQRYNGTAGTNDRANSLEIDAAGNVFITGNSTGSGSSVDIATIKYSSAGAEQWVKRYTTAGAASDFGEAVDLDASGNIYLAGRAGLDYVTIKYNSIGDTLWVRKYDAGGLDHATEIAVFDSDNIYVSGLSFLNSEDYATVKYNAAGVQQWVRRYDGSGGDMQGVQEEIVSAITLDAFGNLYVTGTSYETGTGHDYCTLKYNPGGDQEWIQFYNSSGSSDDQALSMNVDNTGNVYLTGSSAVTSFNQDIITLKYSQTIGIHNISGEIPAGFSLLQNFPNPFNPTTNISFAIPKASFVKLTIFDMPGREVEALVSTELNAGTYNADWNASAYSSGVYFYRLETESFAETRKMVLIK